MQYKIDYKIFSFIIMYCSNSKRFILIVVIKSVALHPNFTIDLPETVQLDDNMLCQIHEVSIPHSWYSINNTSNILYFRHQVLPPGIPSGAIYHKIPIPDGNCTASELATELETQLNNYFDTVYRPETYTVRYNATTNKLELHLIMLPLYSLS